MKVLAVSLNQRRHNWFVHHLAQAVDEVVLLQETTTLAPGRDEGFFRKSDVMQDYFMRVMAAEQKVFGEFELLPPNLRALAVPFGDLKNLPEALQSEVLSCDAAIVFGGSFIKGWLLDALMKIQGINVHLGITPHYRGSSSNFWACYDGRADMIGATIHRLTDKLDGGGILFQVAPQPVEADYFEFGMLAVKAALQEVVSTTAAGQVRKIEPVAPAFSNRDRVTKNAEFTDEVAASFLKNQPTPMQIYDACQRRDASLFTRLRIR